MKILNFFEYFMIFLRFLKKAAVYILIPVLFLYVLIAKPDYAVLSAIQRPVVSIATTIGQGITWPIRAIGNLIDNMSEYNGIAKDNEKLRKLLDQLAIDRNEYEFLKSENQRLLRLLEIKENSKYEIILGKIISNNNIFGSSFMIDVGTDAGVKDGEIVLSTGGNVLGFVMSAMDGYSKVQSLSDIDLNIIVKVSGTEIRGFLHGNNTSRPYFEYFSDPDFKPEIGMKIVSSGMNSLMPENLPIGEIDRIYSESRASVKLYDNPKSVQMIQVLEYDFKDKYKNMMENAD